MSQLVKPPSPSIGVAAIRIPPPFILLGETHGVVFCFWNLARTAIVTATLSAEGKNCFEGAGDRARQIVEAHPCSSEALQGTSSLPYLLCV